MQLAHQTMPVSNVALWSGRTLSALSIAFMLMDAGMKLARARVSVEATIGLGYPESLVFGIGVLLLIPTVLYAVPQTSVLGAILLTGYLGGAVASNVRAGTPLFSNVLFPVYVAAMVWGGLYLREHRLRALVPLRS